MSACKSDGPITNEAAQNAVKPAPAGSQIDNDPKRVSLGLAQGSAGKLTDKFGRLHQSLRISVTDVCNIRCLYCMPSDHVKFLPREHLLSFDQIEKFVASAAQAGIRKVRITGGEPLTRPNLSILLGQLNRIQGIEELALTTNGMLLADKVEALASAGLKRVNISLDTLNETTFRRLSRRNGIDKVIEGIDAAVADSRLTVKLNALVLREINLEDVASLVRFAVQRDIEMRFIEFMPLDADGVWTKDTLVSGEHVRERLAEEFGPLTPIAPATTSQPARSYKLTSGGRVGFIDSVSQPFCSACDRLRLTAEGKLQNCLFGRDEWDVAKLLNDEQTTALDIIQLMQSCVTAKHASHGISDEGFVPPQRAMYQIGG